MRLDMPSKWDQIRAGQAVEIEPGLSGRLNQEKKTLELSNGRVLNVGNNPNFFPQNEKQLAVSKQKEYMEKGAKGPVGEFLHQYTSQGIPGGVGDVVSYITQSGEDYANRKAAEQQVSQRISKESPYISGAATGANIATDIALTRGMSALKAAPLLTVGSAGSRLFTEPENVVSEAALSAAGGKLIDMGGNYLNKVAQRRAASRALPAQQEAVRNSNILGEQNVSNLNKAEAQQFNALRQNVKSANEARLKQHELDLNARQNQMIQAQNAFDQAKATRDAEIIRLKNQAEVAKVQRSANAAQLDAEYKAKLAAAKQEEKRLADEFKLAKDKYEESVKQLPELQKKAQAEHSANVVKNAQQIERSFPKQSKISTEELGVADFIETNLRKSGLAGSPEAARSGRILKSLFPEGELLGGRELSKRYKALEDAIQKSNPEVQQILNNFKNHMGEKLPSILENSITYHKIYPLLKRNIESDVKSILNEIPIISKNMESFKNKLMQNALTNANIQIREGITPNNFIQRLQNGELGREIANSILTAEDFLVDMTKDQLKNVKGEGFLKIFMEDAQRKHQFFVSELTKKLENRLARYEIKATESANAASKKLGKDIKGTYGIAEPVAQPTAPQPPSSVPLPAAPGELPPVAPINIPPPINPPPTPAIPPKPSLLAEPVAPTPQTFIPQAEPTLPAASGMAERTGDLLEKNLLGGGNTLVNNPLTKLAGLKYLLGKAALPAEAAYLGMKGLTSPTAAGEVARMTFKQGGIQAIESWARRYPSYNNGILENPQDRRSLTKEIEDDFSIPIEQKAVLQSKVNRGKPIQEKL